jgi:hypothetical protein
MRGRDELDEGAMNLIVESEGLSDRHCEHSPRAENDHLSTAQRGGRDKQMVFNETVKP